MRIAQAMKNQMIMPKIKTKANKTINQTTKTKAGCSKHLAKPRKRNRPIRMFKNKILMQILMKTSAKTSINKGIWIHDTMIAWMRRIRVTRSWQSYKTILVLLVIITGITTTSWTSPLAVETKCQPSRVSRTSNKSNNNNSMTSICHAMTSSRIKIKIMISITKAISDRTITHITATRICKIRINYK